jgi:hypothetical protein
MKPLYVGGSWCIVVLSASIRRRYSCCDHIGQEGTVRAGEGNEVHGTSEEMLHHHGHEESNLSFCHQVSALSLGDLARILYNNKNREHEQDWTLKESGSLPPSKHHSPDSSNLPWVHVLT